MPLRRPHVFARPFRSFPEIDRASRRALGCRSGRLVPAPAAERLSPWFVWRASAARERRDAVVSRRPASASASPRVPRRRSPPSQLSSPAPPPSHFSPLALIAEECALHSYLLSYSSYSPTRPRSPEIYYASHQKQETRNNPTTCGPKSEGGGTGGERRQGGWAPPRSGRGGECGCGAARDDSIAPPTRRRRPSGRTAAISALPPVPKRALPRRRPRARPWNAADFRKRARPPAQGARTAKRQGVTAIWRLPNPRDARRNARPPPCRRAPEIGRTYTTRTTLHYTTLHNTQTTNKETNTPTFILQKTGKPLRRINGFFPTANTPQARCRSSKDRLLPYPRRRDT